VASSFCWALVTGKPHLGTDRLVMILKNAREHLTAAGVDIVFGATVDRVVFEDVEEADRGAGEAAGTDTLCSPRHPPRANPRHMMHADP